MSRQSNFLIFLKKRNQRKINRNQRKINQKPREASIFLDMGKPVILNKVGISINGEIILKNNDEVIIPEKAFIETSYSRNNPNKPKKILNKISINPNKLVVFANKAFYRFYAIFAVDTNTELIKDNLISVCCVTLCNIKKGLKDDLALFWTGKMIEYRNIKEKQELVTLVEVIKMITSNPDFNETNKLGIVIDSELDNLFRINNQEIPIFDNFFLPKNIELIYASADVGKDFLPNILISHCDKEAKEILNLIKKDPGETMNLVSFTNVPFTHRRIWEKIKQI